MQKAAGRKKMSTYMNSIDLDAQNRSDSYEAANFYTPAELEKLHQSIVNPEPKTRPKFQEATKLSREQLEEKIRRATKIYAMGDFEYLRRL